MELERARGRSGLSDGEVAHFLHQRERDGDTGEVVDGGFRVRMTHAERLDPPLQHLAEQRLSGGKVALDQQQQAEVIEDP